MIARSIKNRKRRGLWNHRKREDRQRSRRLVIERMEDRRLLAIDFSGVPDWIEQGPGPVATNGLNDFGVELEQAGAINGIAPDPNDADRMFVGTVNGGVWRTTTGTYSTADGVDNDSDTVIDEADEFPHWEPLTDQFDSPSIGAVAISPLDSDTVFAGHARFSSGGGDGGPLSGILKSTDGGDTWVPVGENNKLTGLNVFHILPTSIGAPATQVVIVGTNGGLFRSTDGGGSWDLISGSDGSSDGLDNNDDGTVDEPGEINLPNGGITHVIGDPGDSSRFYAVIPAVYSGNTLATASPGILRSDDGGATWQNVTNNINTLSPGLVAGARFLQLATHDSPGNNVVYITVWPNGLAYATGNGPGDVPMNPIQVFRSTNQGDTWVAMDNFPDVPDIRGPGGIAADPNLPTVLFMHGAQGGAAGDPISNHGRVFRADASAASGSQWLRVTGINAGGTGPHPDSRYMAFDANGDLLDSDDGGIYRLVTPNTGATRTWRSVNGDIRSIEFYSTAYDSLNNTVFGGTQDNGSPRQRGNGDPLYPLDWTQPQNCDGAIVQVDNDQTAHPGQTIQYMSGQNLFACGFNRRTVDATNTEAPSASVGTVVDGSTDGGPPANTLGPVENAIPGGSTIGFIQPYLLNSVDPMRMIIGTAFLYESTNQGDNLTSLGGLQDLNSGGIDDDGDSMVDEGDEFRPITPVGDLNFDGLDNNNDGTPDDGSEFARVTALAYGGRLNGVDAPDVLYVGKNGGQLNGVTGNMILRTINATNTMADFTTLTNYPGTRPRDIVLDPDNWQRGYVVDSSSNVYRFENAGASSSDWSLITGNFGSLVPVVDLRTIELFTPTDFPGDDIVLIGGLGGVYRTLNPQDGPATIWTEFNNAGPANQLPKMIVKDLSYTLPTQGGAPFPGDLLLAGTWGRGAWTVDNLSAVIDEPPVLSVCGDEDYVNQDDVIRLVRNSANPLLLDVYLNSVVPVFTASLAAIQQINIFGVGGNDELIVDSTNGLITVPTGIRYNGDGVCPVVDDGDPPFGYDRGFDILTLTQTGGDVQDTETISVGALPGSGSINVDGPTGVQSIFFEELEPIVSDIAATDFLVGADPALASLLQAANTIDYSTSQILVGGGRITVDSFEPIEFRQKENVTISAGAGADWINLDNASPVVGLASLTVNGEAGGDAITLSNLPIAVATTVNAGSGDDLVDGSGVSTAVLTLTGNEGADTLIGGGANDQFDGGDGDDLLIGGAGDNTYIGGSGFDTIGILGTPASNVVDVRQNNSTTLISTVDGDTRTDIFATMERVRVDAADGVDRIRVAHSDALVAVPGNSLPITVLGGEPNASDRLTVQDDGIGDTVIYRKGADHRSGTVSVGPLASIQFEEVEVFSVTPLDSITGGTGTDRNGRLVVFKPDPFESNDALPSATFLGGGATINVDPVIDPGAFAPLGIPGDEDWYQFVAVDTGTLDFQVYFEEVPTLDNGRAGLPGDGALSVLTFDSDGTPMVPGAPLVDPAGNVIGQRVTIPVVRNQTYFLQVAGATLDSVNVYNLSAILVEAPVPQVVDLVAATDSGRSDNDDVTNFDALINGAAEFDIVLDDDRLDEFTNLNLIPDATADDVPTAGADYGVEVFNNAVSIGFAHFVGANTWRFTATNGDLLEGHNNFISAAVWLRDPALPSVLGRGELSIPLHVTLDTIAPPGTVKLHPESDSGVWGFDGTLQDDITSDKTPLLTGATEANAIARVLINNSLLGGTTVAVPLDGDEAFPPPPGYDGNYELQTIVVLPEGLNVVELFVEDLAGNGRDTVADTLLMFVDSEGPVIENVTRGQVSVDGVFNNDFATSLFAPKPSSGPDPLVHSIAVHYSDGPDRVAPFFYDPVFQALALEEGNYSVIGDANGNIPITDVNLVSVFSGPGRATAIYELVFAEALPDDRFTLSISDSIKDIAGNQLDGESNAAAPFEGNDEPQNTPPVFPTGDGEHGGEFLARFTIDSRAEIGVWAAGNVWVDTNGNWSFDPYNLDFTNRDIIYQLGFTSDDIFAGNFAAEPGDVADGFDKIAAYGRVDSDWRWLVDTDNDGVANIERVDPLAINGLPVAGEFDGNLDNGDEVGVFTGSTWYFDRNHDFRLDQNTKLTTSMIGYPIVGDFDHDGFDDLGTWTDDVFQIDLANGALRGWDGNEDFQFRFGYIGVRERPVAADMDLDGFDDLGLWVPDRSGVLPQASGEWNFLVSDGASVLDRIRQDPITGEDVVDYTPIPFGPDIYAQFGDEFALPVVGNFDPPIAGTGSAVSEPAGNLHTNLDNPLDVDADGVVAPLDALLIINFLNFHGSQRLLGAASSAPYLDVNMDGTAAPIDSLIVINYLNKVSAGGSGEGEAGVVVDSGGEPAIVAAAAAGSDISWWADQLNGEHSTNLSRGRSELDRPTGIATEGIRWATPDDALRIGRERFEKEDQLDARQDQAVWSTRWWEDDFLGILATVIHRGTEWDMLDRVFDDWDDA